MSIVKMIDLSELPARKPACEAARRTPQPIKTGETAMRRNARIFHARIASLMLLVLLAANMVAAPLPVAHAAATWYVQPDGGGSDENDSKTPATPCATINATLGKAAPGDTISLANGIYFENVVVNKDITIVGASAAAATIDADLSGTVVTIGAGVMVSITGVTINGGSAATPAGSTTRAR